MKSLFNDKECSMESNQVLPPAANFTLPIAHVRSVYQTADVERKLEQLQQHDSREYDNLRSTYERMLERGPDRFQVKPSGIPDMAPLYDALPNFTDALDDVRRHVALSQDSTDGLEVTPMLLLGSPGIGKTHFAKQLADLIGTGMSLVSMSSLTAGWVLSGSASQWKGAKPGKVFEALVDGQYANPVIVVDEIDKAAREAQYDPLGSLYSLLEHDTARSFVDEFAEVPIDASQVLWIMTANDERCIPKPILNRMNVFEIQALTPSQARHIALRLYQSIRVGHEWGTHFEANPSDDVLDKLAGIVPREMRRALMTAFGNARLAMRDTLQLDDLPRAALGKSRMGFVH
jgi:ATP-dependent Lon protease